MDIPEHFHFCHRRLVDFADTDLSGLVHFANFLRYVENAEHAFFRSLGFRVHTSEGPEHEGWPRLEVSCRYYKPARFEDNLEICLRMEEMRTSSLRYAFWIFGEKLAAPGLVAAGTCVTIHVGLDTVGRTIGKTPIPADLRRSLETVMASPGVRPALRTGSG